MVDKGGADYSDITTAFNIFKEQVIESILNHTHLPKDHFIIIPGNHDIERNADKPFENAGLRVEFKTKGLSYINQYTKSLLENPDKQGAQRIVKYKKFESELYHDCPNINCSFLSTTFRYNVDGDEIGFAGLNSAWNAYDDNDYEEGLVLGEPQYNVCLSNLKDCRIKIALMHHPLDWLKLEKGTIGKLYYNDFNLSLVGHVHDGNTTFETKLYGTLFTNIAPSCTSDIRDGYYGAFANGVSIIEYNPESKSIDCSYYIYSFADRSYILNSGIVEGGKCHFTIPNPNSSNLQDITENALKYIKEHYYPIMDGYIIPQKANIIQSLKDAFVMPPIKKHGVSAAEPIIIDFNYILKNKSHQAFFGSHESGKTVLLYRLLIEYVEHYIQYDLIPVYIDFEEMGNKNIDTIIKEFIDCSSSQIKELLATQNFVLLIDNYNPIPENAYKTQRLYKFVQDYLNDLFQMPGTIEFWDETITEELPKRIESLKALTNLIQTDYNEQREKLLQPLKTSREQLLRIVKDYYSVAREMNYVITENVSSANEVQEKRKQLFSKFVDSDKLEVQVNTYFQKADSILNTARTTLNKIDNQLNKL